MVPGIERRVSRKVEPRTMMNVECPWCAGPATIADGDEFDCPDCAVRVELAPDPITETIAVAA
jgi:endogenous inhibitor of DNA gyrase (YacG/DUF329 family)